jgi:polar amino acid transport system substrate-binding protein
MLLLAFIFLSPSFLKKEISTGSKDKGNIGVASSGLSAPIEAALAAEQKPKDTLVIAISSDFEPFTFLNAEGKPAGMFVDIWRLWAQKTGKQIEFIASDWKTSLENLKNQNADIHSGFIYPPEHFEWITVFEIFYESGLSLFYPLKQGKISDIRVLSGQTVAVLRRSQAEAFVIKHHPDIRILACDTKEELVTVSLDGKAKGFITTSQVGASAIDRLGLSGEFEMHDRKLYSDKFHAGVLKKNTELLALVDKGFHAISYPELTEIEARWIPDPAKRYYGKPANMIRLTPEEETWLRNHKTIRVGMSPVIPPLKFSENGVIKGIEPDYLNLLSEYAGIRFEYVICDFSVMDAKVKSGEMDMFISYYIPERLAYMTFTKPLVEFKQIIVARADAPFMSGIGALKGKKVATVKGVKLYEKLFSPYPDIEVVPVGSLEEMFKAVSESKADALMLRTYAVGYVLQHYPNLRIAGIVDLPPEPLFYAIRKDYPELVAILDKAIASITRDRHDAILQKWINVRIEYRPNWSGILKWVLVIGGVFTLLLGLSLSWNKRLSREIDKRKRAEEEQRKITEELERSNMDFQQFAYVASHDLQEPLRMISSYLQLIERRYQDKLDSDANDFIHYAVDGANRMQQLIQDLLCLSRVTTKGQPRTRIQAKDVLKEALSNLQATITETGALITHDDLPEVDADRTQLVQVFQNLIGNAIKFRKSGEPPRVHVSSEQQGSEWVFSVQDNGIGIDPQYFDRIFVIFQRLHTRETYPGTGIGLALCKRIAERHGGRIWVASEPEKGTVFRFTLPITSTLKGYPSS